MSLSEARRAQRLDPRVRAQRNAYFARRRQREDVRAKDRDRKRALYATAEGKAANVAAVQRYLQRGDNYQQKKLYERSRWDNCGDRYVLRMLNRQGVVQLPKHEVPTGLIEAKRLTLFIHRQIRGAEHEKRQ